MAFADWLRVEQITAAGHAEIGARRIYILPTRYGLVFGVLLFLMLLGAVNYGNNPAHLLTFVVGALASNAIYLTWRNLRGLRLVCRGAAPAFAGQAVQCLVELVCDERERPALQLAFPDSEPLLLDLPGNAGSRVCTLELVGLPRGEHWPGRLLVSTRYPLGLFRAWCYVACDRPLLVYPAVGPHWVPPGDGGCGGDGASGGEGSEDFAGLRGYLSGDPPALIDWKSYARDRGLNTRLFSGQAAAPLWLAWEAAPGADTEARLAALTRAVLDAEAGGRRYGLRLPGQEIEPGLGPAHRHRCLRALARFGQAGA